MEKKDTKIYTTKEVLEIVGIARATLYKWLRDGKIPEVNRDRNYYRIFTEDDVNRMLNFKNLIKKPIEASVLRVERIKKKT